jgi:AAA+ ATPase superfamily predicted ATPase
MLMNTLIMNMNMMNMFIDRGRELAFLEKRFQSGRAELVVVYGRRRVGKTFLLRRFLAGKRGVYFVVTRLGDILRELSEAMGEQLGVHPPLLRSYRELFKYVAEQCRESRLVLVIDEFQRLAEHDPAFLMELQAAWDEFLHDTKVFLVLSGSSVGVVERAALSSSSPIFGRRTGQLKVKPFAFSCAKEFTPGWPCEDKVRAYAVFGGTPAYLSLLDSSKSLLENIKNLVLEPGAPLREEPYFLLAAETREPLRYMAILEAMASGATTLGEIASKSGLSSSELPRYMRVLEAMLDIVERSYPLLEEGRRGRARYWIKDNFLRFWFKFVRPNLYLLELGEVERVASRIAEQLDEYVSTAFEDIALEHFSRAVPALRVGRWWRGEVEIDGVAIDERSKVAYFMEAKWSRHPLDKRALRELERKAEAFDWKIGERREVYFLYSRSGFAFEAEENVKLIDLEELCAQPCT